MKRLLNLAQSWPDSLPAELPQAVAYRTARQLEPAEVDELAALYAPAAGIGVDQLADKFNIHRATVGRHLKSRGIDTTPPVLQPGDVLVAASLYRAGWSLARIGDKFGAGATTVKRRLAEVGVELRPKGWPTRQSTTSA